jgi:hypothetical protein
MPFTHTRQKILWNYTKVFSAMRKRTAPPPCIHTHNLYLLVCFSWKHYKRSIFIRTKRCMQVLLCSIVHAICTALIVYYHLCSKKGFILITSKRGIRRLKIKPSTLWSFKTQCVMKYHNQIEAKFDQNEQWIFALVNEWSFGWNEISNSFLDIYLSVILL